MAFSIVRDDHGANPTLRQYSGGEQCARCGGVARSCDPRRVRRHLRPTPLRHCNLHSRYRRGRSPVTDRRALPMVLAVTEPSGQNQYPAEFEVRDRSEREGRLRPRAAEFVNYSSVRLVSCAARVRDLRRRRRQGYILDFVRALRVPVIVTLHTAAQEPVSESGGDYPQDAGLRRAARRHEQR